MASSLSLISGYGRHEALARRRAPPIHGLLNAVSEPGKPVSAHGTPWQEDAKIEEQPARRHTQGGQTQQDPRTDRGRVLPCLVSMFI